MRTLDRILADTSVFAGLRDEWLALVAGCGRNVRFAPGQPLFREGEPADSFFLIRHGVVAVDLHVPGRGEVVVETLDDGEVVGWSWLFPPYRWHFDGRAVEAVAAVEFDGACLRGKCEQDTALGFELMRRFAGVTVERLHSAQFRLLDVYGSVPVV